MLRGLVASCHGISKHPCSLGMVLLHSFAALYMSTIMHSACSSPCSAAAWYHLAACFASSGRQVNRIGHGHRRWLSGPWRGPYLRPADRELQLFLHSPRPRTPGNRNPLTNTTARDYPDQARALSKHRNASFNVSSRFLSCSCSFCSCSWICWNVRNNCPTLAIVACVRTPSSIPTGEETAGGIG